MSSSTKAEGQYTAPHCSHCGFEMTPMQLGHGPGIEAMDQVYECRSCGVMTMPEPPALSADSPARLR
jgi:predicted RNA-binding Zn-ribbon protein involved in translation (DUF1610 family)